MDQKYIEQVSKNENIINQNNHEQFTKKNTTNSNCYDQHDQYLIEKNFIDTEEDYIELIYLIEVYECKLNIKHIKNETRQSLVDIFPKLKTLKENYKNRSKQKVEEFTEFFDTFSTNIEDLTTMI